MDLTDAQWAILEPVFRPKRRSDGRGRPWRDTRSVLNGVLWILRTGAQWRELPSKYPPYQTCHRRFQSWQRSGLLTRVLQKLAEDLRDRVKIDLSETFIDASFSSAKKGASGALLSELNQLQQPERSESFLDFSFASFKLPFLAPRNLTNGNAARRKYPPCMQILWVPLSNCVASQQSKLKFEPTPTFVASLRGYQSVVLDIRQRGSSRIGEVIPRPDCLHPFPVGEDWFVAHTLMNFARRKIRSPYLHGYEPLAQVWR